MLSRVENGGAGQMARSTREENSAAACRGIRSGPAITRRNHRGRRGAYGYARLACFAAAAHGCCFRGATLAAAAAIGRPPAVWLYPALSISVAAAATTTAEVAGGGADRSREASARVLSGAKRRDGSTRGGLGRGASAAATDGVFDR